MENYEEKYNKAIDVIKRIKEVNKDNAELVDFIEYNYPELKKSDDEKIRKDIISFVEQAIDAGYGIISKERKEKWIAWLEKQGEQQPLTTEDKDADKAAEEYRNFRLSCGIKDPAMLHEIEEAYYEGAIRQKPIERSEEDEKMLEDCIGAVAAADYYPYEDKQNMEKWLESLKPQSHWKPSDEMLAALYRVSPENVMEKSEDEILLDKLYQGLKYGRVLSK